MHTLMLVHAHPDDEVFATGGTIASYAHAGNRVVVVYATSGDVGEMFHAEMEEEEGRRQLASLREAEARKACEILGTTDVHFLRYRDSGMKDWEENKDPAAFMNAPLDDAAGRLLDIMRDVRPDVVITYDESGGYDHPDHVMSHKVTLAAFERAAHEERGPKKLYYSAFSREGFRRFAQAANEAGVKIPWVEGDLDFEEIGHPDSQITARIDISQFAPLKKKALAVHKTQIKPDFFYLQIPDDVLTNYAGIEYFMRAHPPHTPGDHETDLFANP